MKTFKFKSLRPLTLLLGCFLCGLAALCVMLVWRGLQTNSVLSANAKSIAAPEFKTSLPKSDTDFSSVRLRAVFYSSRGFYVAPLPSVVDPPLPKPNYRLTGTIAIPNKPMRALMLAIDTNTTSKVAEGDELDVWHVKTIESARVVLQHGAQTEEIVRESHGPSMGLTAQPLMRDSRNTLGGTIRLGQGISGGNSVSPTLIDKPRLYRPPPN